MLFFSFFELLRPRTEIFCQAQLNQKEVLRISQTLSPWSQQNWSKRTEKIHIDHKSTNIITKAYRFIVENYDK